MSCQDGLFRALREQGMRVTPQREMILTVLHDLEDHASVEDIYRRVQEKSSAVDISTVYRTLELLQSMNMLAVARRRLTDSGGSRCGTRTTSMRTSCAAGAAESSRRTRSPWSNSNARCGRCTAFPWPSDHVTLAGRCAGCCED